MPISSPALIGPYPPIPSLGSSQGVTPRSRYPSYLLSLGPALYWRLGDNTSTAADSSGNARTGTYGAGITNQVPGGLAGDLDTAVTLTTAFSAAVVTSSYSPFVTSSVRTFVGLAKRLDHSTQDDIFASSGGINRCALNLASGVSQTVQWAPQEFATSSFGSWTGAWPGDGVWVHWALIFDEGADTAELFINGTSQGVQTVADNYLSTGNINLGGASGEAGANFDGDMDEFAVFERALSSSQISVLAAIARGDDIVIPASYVLTVVDSLTASESLTRGPVVSSRSLSDSVTLSESVSRVGSNPRASTDSITFAESLVRGALLITRTDSDAVTFAESLTRLVASPRTDADTATLADALTRGAVNNPRGNTDSATFAEALTRSALSFSRPVTDSLTLGRIYASTVLADTPQVYYRLEETSGSTVADSSGNSRDGTVVSTPTLGKTGALAEGDLAVGGFAVGKSITIGSGLSIPSGTPLTIEFWAKGPTTGNGRPFTIGNQIGSNDCSVYLPLNSDQKVYWTYGAGTPGQNLLVSTATFPTDNAWHHWVFVAGTGIMAIYLDGALFASQGQWITPPPSTLTGGAVGGKPVTNEFYPGDIDEFAVYNSVLSAARITAHYVAGVGAGLTRTVSLPRVSTDSITSADALTRGPVNLSAALASSLTLSESLTRILSDPRALTDSLTLSESFVSSRGATRPISDALTASDALTRGALNNPRSLTGAITLADALTRVVSETRSFSDSATMAESLARIAAHPRTVTDALTMSDALTRAVNLSALITSTLTLADAQTRGSVSETRTLSDSTTMAESLARVAAHPRALTEAITMSDALTRGPTSLTAAITGALTLADALTRTVSNPRALTDSITFAEALTYTYHIARALTDALTFAETLTRAAAVAKTSTDAITLSAALTRGAVGDVRALNETLTLAESLARGALSGSRNNTDAMTLAETLTRAESSARTLSAALSLTDALARGSTQDARSLADAVTWAEQLTRGPLNHTPRSITDAMTLNQAVVRVVTVLRTATETLTLADTLVRAPISRVRSEAEFIAFAEDLVGSLGLGAMHITDHITATDVATLIIEIRPTGQIVVRLVPHGTTSPLVKHEGRVNVAPRHTITHLAGT